MPALGKERLHSLTGKREKELCLRVRHLCDSLRGIMSSKDVQRERERERERANFVAKKGEGELVAADDVKLKKDVISFH